MRWRCILCASYLRYFERAGTELLRSVNIDIGKLAEKGIVFIVSRAEIDYLSPARYREILMVKSTVAQVKNASFIITYPAINISDSRLLSRGMKK
ncbi:MAG: thioesterase family protein [Proteobacteria bacterium]|nr:thioesterase family protein [Pseudomonadota bacterium]